MGALTGGMARIGGIRIFGIPVSVDLTFLIVAALLSSSWTGGEPSLLLLGIGVVVFSILIHELGHAFVFRSLGAAPSIRLTGFGGLTSAHSTGRGWPRWGQLVATAAGPAAGFLLAGVAWTLQRTLPVPNLMTLIALEVFVYLNVLWSALNLLPIFPLDGGQLLRELLRLFRRRNPERTSVLVSIVVGLAAAGLALSVQEYWGAAIAAYLVFVNWGSLQHTTQQEGASAFNAVLGPYLDGGDFPESALRATLHDRAAPQEQRAIAAAYLLHWSLVAGRTEDKVALHDALAPAPALRDLVPEGDRPPLSPLASARALFDAQPGTPTSALLVRELAAAGRFEELRDFAVHNLHILGVQGSWHVQTQLFRAGRYELAADVAQRTWDEHADPLSAYNLACCAEKRGDLDAGLVWLMAAIKGGFTDAEQLDADDDLQGVRNHPDYPKVRARLAA